ncbi:MAG TPA: cyclic nucleotide-binding domain-containing protein [Xanthobacteraceae bacterium]|nr:cyclic nucleotide-binding domain-containing protein [Xanthobacteraceae bacterium]
MNIDINWIELLGYIGAFLTLGTYSMKTMIPLRIVGICSNIVFIAYGWLAPVYPQLLLHGVLLSLNTARLYQMVKLIEKVRVASQGDLKMDWLKAFMTKRACTAGEVIFRKDDPASAMFYTVSGRYRLTEIGADVLPGQVVGELGLIAPDNKRTLTFECVEDGELLTISYSGVKQLYFQNPKFGFYLLQLISQRMFQNIARLEDRLAQFTHSSGTDSPGR